jgi:hypothetical protein
MGRLSEVSVQEFESKLGDHVKLAQVMQAALGVTPLIYAILGTYFVAFGRLPGNADSIGGSGFPGIFFAVLTALIIFVLSLAPVIPDKILFSDRALELVANSTPAIADPCTACHLLLRQRQIVRCAIIETAAIFGLIGVLLAGMFTLLPSRPVYWLFLAPCFIVSGWLFMTLPNAETWTADFKRLIRKENS